MLPKHALMCDIKIGNKNTGCIRFVLFDFHLQFWLPYDGLKDTLTHDNFGLKKIQIFCFNNISRWKWCTCTTFVYEINLT